MVIKRMSEIKSKQVSTTEGTIADLDCRNPTISHNKAKYTPIIMIAIAIMYIANVGYESFGNYINMKKLNYEVFKKSLY